MEAKEIIEGNKLIAEFMGGEWVQDDYNEWGYKIDSPHWNKLQKPEALQYHTSLDWLMPVYYKFRDLKMKSVNAKHYHKQVLASFSNGVLNSDIKGAWSDAVMAVKWYNNQIN